MDTSKKSEPGREGSTIEDGASYLRNWIYSYLKYGAASTPKQMKDSEDRLRELLKERKAE